MVLFRLLAFVDPGTASGASFRSTMAANGGVAGLLCRAAAAAAGPGLGCGAPRPQPTAGPPARAAPTPRPPTGSSPAAARAFGGASARRVGRGDGRRRRRSPPTGASMCGRRLGQAGVGNQGYYDTSHSPPRRQPVTAGPASAPGRPRDDRRQRQSAQRPSRASPTTSRRGGRPRQRTERSSHERLRSIGHPRPAGLVLRPHRPPGLPRARPPAFPSWLAMAVGEWVALLALVPLWARGRRADLRAGARLVGRPVDRRPRPASRRCTPSAGPACSPRPRPATDIGTDPAARPTCPACWPASGSTTARRWRVDAPGPRSSRTTPPAPGRPPPGSSTRGSG